MSTSRLPDPQSDLPAAQANWLELDRSPHALQLYSGDDSLLDSLARFISTALEAGDSVFILATEAHLEGLAERLRAREVDTDTAARKGRYVAVEALQVLARLTVNGELNRARFDEFIREVFMPLEAAAESSPSKENSRAQVKRRCRDRARTLLERISREGLLPFALLLPDCVLSRSGAERTIPEALRGARRRHPPSESPSQSWVAWQRSLSISCLVTKRKFTLVCRAA